MTKEERDNLAARLRRMSEGHKQYQNIYHDGVAEGFLKAAVVVEKMDEGGEKAAGWIKMSDADRTYYCCPKCGEEGNRTRFCPFCGAKMEGWKQ